MCEFHIPIASHLQLLQVRSKTELSQQGLSDQQIYQCVFRLRGWSLVVSEAKMVVGQYMRT